MKFKKNNELNNQLTNEWQAVVNCFYNVGCPTTNYQTSEAETLSVFTCYPGVNSWARILTVDFGITYGYHKGVTNQNKTYALASLKGIEYNKSIGYSIWSDQNR